MNQVAKKAVLFDLDGVLLEARDWHYEALNKALGLFGFTISREEHDGFYNGLPTRKKLAKLSEEKGLSPALHDFISEMKQRHTTDYIYNFARPSFDKQLLLRRLKEKGFKLGVCSNAIRTTVEMMLEKMMLENYFDVVLSNQDVENNKPHPEIYLMAMERLGVTAEETLIVEDAPPGIEAAKASGATVVVVSGPAEVNLRLLSRHLEDL